MSGSGSNYLRNIHVRDEYWKKLFFFEGGNVQLEITLSSCAEYPDGQPQYNDGVETITI